MHRMWNGLLVFGALVVAACNENPAPTAESDTPSLGKGTPSTLPALTGTPAERAAQIAGLVNARLEAGGSTVRLDEAWFFTVGPGTDPFRRLRTPSGRWVNPRSVTYAIDLSDLVTHRFGAPFNASQVEAALVRSHERFNEVDGIVLKNTRVPENGANNDILDGIIRNRAGECVDVVDLRSVILNSYDPATGTIDFNPVADNLFGGWLAPEYFRDCLGSENIIGVTWSFSDADGALTGETDGYADRAYTEQFYNTRFAWNVTGAVFLDPSPQEVFDIESIVTHEVGHTHGLGHFGGPNANEPFKLQPNGSVFDPEAVMNPFYLGGEKRSLFPTDISALHTMYASKALE